MSSYRSLVVGATIFFGMTVLTVLTDAMSIDNTVFIIIIIMIATIWGWSTSVWAP
jgi:hypothetical protein